MKIFTGSSIRSATMIILALALNACASAPAPDKAAESRAIRAVLEAQVAAWNRGDIDGFMQGYAQSEQLRFAGGAQVTYGWKATRDNYVLRYPNRAAMGTLSFTDLGIDVLAADAANIFGRWSLAREKDNPHGVFSLTMLKGDARWKIVTDHSSAAQ